MIVMVVIQLKPVAKVMNGSSICHTKMEDGIM